MIYFFKFTLIKSTQWNNLRFFSKACTHIFNNINFRLQGLQIGAFQQRYLKCKCETPYFEGELVPKTCKNKKMSSTNFVLSGLVTKLEKLFVLGIIYEKSAQPDGFKKSCWLISLRLEHWKSVSSRTGTLKFHTFLIFHCNIYREGLTNGRIL